MQKSQGRKSRHQWSRCSISVIQCGDSIRLRPQLGPVQHEPVVGHYVIDRYVGTYTHLSNKLSQDVPLSTSSDGVVRVTVDNNQKLVRRGTYSSRSYHHGRIHHSWVCNQKKYPLRELDPTTTFQPSEGPPLNQRHNTQGPQIQMKLDNSTIPYTSKVECQLAVRVTP